MSQAMALSSPLLVPLPYHHGVSHRSIGRNNITAHKSRLLIQHTRPNLSCSVSMSDGESDNQKKLNLDNIINNSREIWNRFPKPMKNFPWNRMLENFIQLVLDVTISVIKYLSVPLLAVSSLSEMSYCAHERKLFLIPIPLVLGFALVGIVNKTAQEVSPLIKDSEVPWHLIAIGVLLAFFKLPGPYYPYWARFFIPHFANGGLLRVVVMMWFWYRRPKKGHLLPNLESSE